MLLCPVAGGSPGRVAEISPNLTLVAEHPKTNKNIDNFNPHGKPSTPQPSTPQQLLCTVSCLGRCPVHHLLCPFPGKVTRVAHDSAHASSGCVAAASQQ
jgi:hypothetical protein